MRRWVAALVLAVAWVGPSKAADSFVTFETGQVRPLALSPDSNKLFAVNTPDGRLEIFDVEAGGFTHVASVPVGMEPLAVAARTNSEVWVVNHLSDSVSIVDVSSTPPRVTRTLLVGDEPRDIVFAGSGGNRAFITTAHRGQNSPVDPQLTSPGVGRADVWVFDAANLGSSLGGDPITIITLFGDTPRALARSADGSTVYAAVFHSGNQTTTITEGAVCNGGESASPCTVDGEVMPGGLPGPNTNFEGVPQPEVGLIVKFNKSTGEWEDDLGRDWSGAVRFSLPDKDVFAINANANPPVESASFSGVGTILFNMVVNPGSGKVYVSNTEAGNEVRFEGTGTFSGSTVRGRLHQARITVLDGTSVTPRHLNKHINYNVVPSPAGTSERSLATPLSMAVTSNGSTLYVAAFGSSKIGIFSTSALENGTFTPDSANHIAVSGGGPSGLVLDEPRGRLYVLTRFNNSVAVVDTAAKVEIASISLHNPEPAAVVDGRPFLYDASFTSSNGEASCSSCHVFGDFDSLGWDLGDPDGQVLNNPNPIRLRGPGFISKDFHPMKGPMTTQSLRGMANHGPMHWRGDRTGGNDPGGSGLDEEAAFKKFNVAFEGLLGRGEPLTDEEMQAFTDFILQVTYPPNPIRNLDNSLTADQQAGRDFYFGPVSDGVFNCNGCHVLNPDQGFFGSDGFTTFEGETQLVKIPHLRNMYQKVGMFGMPDVGLFNSGDNDHTGDQIRGFGFLHDGSVDTLFRFHSAIVFNFSSDAQRRQVEEFMHVYDSNLAPIVGQQVTLTNTNASTVGSRIDLLIARAAAGECDLIAKGNLNGEARGWVRTSNGRFQSDRSDELSLTDSSLRSLATTPGQEVTYTCVPPGSGVRAGVDRDDDGSLDADESDAGSGPTNPSEVVLKRPRLKVSNNLDPAGDEKMTLSGEMQLAADETGVDPISNGFAFEVQSGDGTEVFSRVVPPGAAGWSVNGGGNRWKFSDPSGGVADGITKIIIRQKGPATSPVLKLVVKGADADFQIPQAALPVRVLASASADTNCSSAPCGVRRFFNDENGAKPSCASSGGGNSVSCR